MIKILKKFYLGLLCVLSLFSCDKSDQSASPSPSTNGVGGSMARFAISGDYLYTVDTQDLKVFDISNPSSPVFKKDIKIGWGIETIFPYQQNLFLGSQAGMYIYDIANPLNPVQLSVYQHLTACDPVVVQGDRAFVTLRNGSDCRLGQNLLDVINISNLQDPVLTTSISMMNPHGLALKQNALFVCEGDYGIKIFDISNPDDPEMISHQEGFHAYDVIALPKSLIITGNDGLYQYDYADLHDLKLLSIIPVTQE